ncbi:MAG TPA: TolC family protein [Cryomorphaceae bacterium]|nr:TolC family protein [Cryomorphaceae bacterium]
MKRNFYIAVLTVFGLTQSLVTQAQKFGDYFSMAAENNPGLQAEYKMFEAALAKVDQANSLSDPTLSFGYFISPVETRVGPQRARISLSQMFPWFGTLKAGGNVAALNAEAKYQSFLDSKNALYYDLAQAYYPLFELEKWMELEEQNIEILQLYKTISTSKFENGEGSMVDVLRVDLMLKDSETNLQILKEKKRPLLSKFNGILNRDEFTEVAVSDSLLPSAGLIDFQKDSIYSKHPLIGQLELKMDAAEAQSELAAKQGLPKIGVGLDYVLVDKRTDLAPGINLPDDGKDALMPMVSLSVPLYRGKYKAAKKEANLIKEAYSLQKEDLINRLASEYEMSTFKISEQTELMQLYREQIAETEQVLNLLYSDYGNSGEDFEELLRVRQQLLKYEKLNATAQKEYQIALAKLNYITAR